MGQPKRAFQARAIPNTTWRRLRSTPSYFFLVWRWSTWLYALIVIIGAHPDSTVPNSVAITQICIILLIVTFIQTLTVTLYAPVFQILLPHLSIFRLLSRRQRPLAEDGEADILAPLAHTHSPYWDIAIYSLDVIICGLVVYFSGPFGDPPFGVGSPFYRYGMSTAFAAALAYRYRGGLAAAIGYDLFALAGMYIPAPYALPHTVNVIDFFGSLIDVPIAAILAAYLASIIRNYTQSKRREQDNVRRQTAILGVAETIVREANNKEALLQKSAERIRQGGHFQRLVLALIHQSPGEHNEQAPQPVIETCIEVDVDVPHPQLLQRNQAILDQVIRTTQKYNTFESFSKKDYGIARLYLPFFKDGQVQMVLGAESSRQTPFDPKQENFLAIAGTQLLVALDNIRLTEQTVELAATLERRRIAREIHDGIAQLIYMQSLNAETCATLAHRMEEHATAEATTVTPLADRLDKLVIVSKQALWETRNYMFSLKPLMSGTTTLTQMLTNQLREFETISDLPVSLEVTGNEELLSLDRRSSSQYTQIGTAIFRIVQEALTNAYKHANATQIRVCLHYLPDSIKVEICDNGQGLAHNGLEPATDGGLERIYSGHGLRGMHERAEELGGTLAISQLPASGVKVSAQLPI